MKTGILQFFGWRDRSVPLHSVYETALERFSIMDQTGYDAVWLAEHHFSSFSVCPSVHMMGTMAAARTKRLRIGTAVSLAPFYNPLRLAEEVALLDVLSGGRVNWGAGRGFERSEFAAFGIPGEESAPRFHEAVEIVLKAWTNQRLNYEGKYFQYDSVEVLPKPLQAPHPPVWMAASSIPAIEWAAGQGHSILMDPHSSRADLIRKRRHYAAKLAEAGYSDAGRMIPMARLVAVDETARRRTRWRSVRRNGRWLRMSGAAQGNVRQEVRTFGGKDPIDFYLEDVMIHGTAESVADQIMSFGGGDRDELSDGGADQRPFVPDADREGVATHSESEKFCFELKRPAARCHCGVMAQTQTTRAAIPPASLRAAQRRSNLPREAREHPNATRMTLLRRFVLAMTGLHDSACRIHHATLPPNRRNSACAPSPWKNTTPCPASSPASPPTRSRAAAFPGPDFVWAQTTKRDELADLGDARLADMDASGITMQVLSVAGPGADLVPGQAGIDLARAYNDALAEACARHPTRYRGFAHLPLLAPDAAARRNWTARSRNSASTACW